MSRQSPQHRDAAVGSAHGRRRVAMVQAWVPQYRRAFYEGLRERLAEKDIEFELIHGSPIGDQAAKQDTVEIPWATIIEARTVPIGSRTLLWRPCVRRLAGADLVIVPQKSSHVENYALLARQLRGRQRLALWGHGRNFQNASALAELVKRVVSTRVHWWFAYNELSARVVEGLGYPVSRITVVNNAIDTREIRQWADEVTGDQLAKRRQELGIEGARVGAFVGGLYGEKRLPYLIEACDEIRTAVPDFEMLVLGGGPDAAMMEAAAASRPWLHVLGPRFDQEKVELLALADVLLMPGLVGLAILDAFALGLPLVTLADSQHSPEIDYLENGVNGLMLPAGTSPADYAAEVAALFAEPQRLQRLADAGRADSERYTMEAMVERFATGVVQALDTKT